MKKIRTLTKIFFLSLILAFSAPTALALPGTAAVQAAAKINRKSVVLIKGQSKTLKVTGTKGKAKWSSSNKKIASVSSSGKVTARRKGTAKITAKIGKKTFTCKVTVQTPKISASKLTLKKGKSSVLKLTGTNQKVTWSSSNKKIVTVNKNGRLTAKKAGKATVTATVLKKKYRCVVTVKSSGSSAASSSAAEKGYPSKVWITSSGKKFHDSKECSNMKHPVLVSLSAALSSGRDACSKCF